MGSTPMKRWLKYARKYYANMGIPCVINKKEKNIFFPADGTFETWDEELHSRLAETLKDVKFSGEIKDYYTYVLRKEGGCHAGYSCEILTKDFAFLLSISEFNDEMGMESSLTVSVKKRKAKRYSAELKGYKREIYIDLKRLSKALKKAYLNRNSVRIKHLFNSVQFYPDEVFNDIYKEKVKKTTKKIKK